MSEDVGPMARLVVNGRFLTRQTTGVDRVAEEVVRALDALLCEGSLPGVEIEIVVPESEIRALPLAAIPVRRAGKRRGHAWEQIDLPRAARGAFLLNLCNTAPIATREALVTIHDAQVYQAPHSYSRAFRALYRVLLPAISRRCRAVTTVSRFSKSELERFGVTPAGKVTVIPNGCDHMDRIVSDETALDRFGVAADGYMLVIGSLAPHKNLATALAAQSRQTGPIRRLVVAGGGNPRIFGEADLPHCPDAMFIGRVGDAELRALYEGAAGLIFPSRFEGFGLPPLEAMRCGCPVIASTAAAVREVCGEAALYADPDDVDGWAAQIGRLGSDASLRRRLRAAGKERAGGFAWRRSALGLLAAAGYAAPPALRPDRTAA